EYGQIRPILMVCCACAATVESATAAAMLKASSVLRIKVSQGATAGLVDSRHASTLVHDCLEFHRASKRLASPHPPPFSFGCCRGVLPPRHGPQSRQRSGP